MMQINTEKRESRISLRKGKVFVVQILKGGGAWGMGNENFARPLDAQSYVRAFEILRHSGKAHFATCRGRKHFTCRAVRRTKKGWIGGGKSTEAAHWPGRALLSKGNTHTD